MSEEMYNKIYKALNSCGVYNHMNDYEVYSCENFITKFGDKLNATIIEDLKNNVGRLQRCFDGLVLEPK